MSFEKGDKVKSISNGWCRRIGTIGVVQSTPTLSSPFYIVFFGKMKTGVRVLESDIVKLTPLEEVLL